MEREIKFRRIFKKGSEIKITYWGFLEKGIFTAPSSISGWDLIGDGQFTGLKDNNEKDIYENDIVEVCVFLVSLSNPDDDNHFRGVIDFQNGFWTFNISKYMNSSTKGKFINCEYGSFPFDKDWIENGIFKIPFVELCYQSSNLGEYNEENVEIIGNIHQHKHLLEN